MHKPDARAVDAVLQGRSHPFRDLRAAIVCGSQSKDEIEVKMRLQTDDLLEARAKLTWALCKENLSADQTLKALTFKTLNQTLLRGRSISHTT